MIAKDKNFSVAMDALNQVCRRRRTEKLVSYSHDVTERVAANSSNTKRFGYISYWTSLTMILLFLVTIAHHIQKICISMRIAQCLGRFLPYISMICWYASFSSGNFVIRVGIKNKMLEVECYKYSVICFTTILSLLTCFFAIRGIGGCV